MAGAIRMLAGLVARHVFEHAQGHVRFLAAQRGQRIQPQLASGRLGGQKEQAVQLLAGKRLELGKQRGQGLADAGGGLGQQGLAVPRCTVDGLGKLSLAAAIAGVRKAQSLEALVAFLAVGRLLFRPGQKTRTLQLEEFAQRLRPEALAQNRFLLADDIEVHHRQIHFLQIQLRTQQPAVDLDLRPVQQPVILRNAADIAAVRLDLFQQVLVGIVTVRPATDLQVLKAAAQCQFAQVGCATPRCHRAMPGHALLGSGRRGEAQIQIPFLGSELAQTAHGDAVAHVSVHCTWHTCTGMSWRAQKAIQRRWLSCSRSPGPFTSIIR